MDRIATIPHIVGHHAQDAAFLWSRRRREVDEAVAGEIALGRIDQRLDANLEGLFASGAKAWDVALGLFADYEEPAELFVIGCLALYWQDDALITKAIDLGRSIGKGGLSALSGAIARATPDQLRPHVGIWLDSTDPFRRSLGLSALWHARADAGQRLEKLVDDGDPEVRRRAVRLAGALRRHDLLAVAIAMLDEPDADLRLAAAQAACLLGGANEARQALDRLTFASGKPAVAALELRILSTDRAAARRWLQERLDQAATRELALAAIGLAADPSIMPWLVERMKDPRDVFAAGKALRDLYPVDFNDTRIFTPNPRDAGKEFEQIEDGPVPMAGEAERWWKDGALSPTGVPFVSMRRIRIESWRASLANPQLKLANWRRTRQQAAWI